MQKLAVIESFPLSSALGRKWLSLHLFSVWMPPKQMINQRPTILI
jgi:hypothetical protein